jgi:hypothetical protein
MKRRIALIIAGVCLLAGSVISVIVLGRTHSANAVAPQTGAATEPIDQLLITIRPGGFDPQEIVHAKGKLLLSVDNRSGLQAVELRLDAERGSRLQAKRVPREELDWRELVDLNPGTYLLTEAAHPEWVCRIVVTSR